MKKILAFLVVFLCFTGLVPSANAGTITIDYDDGTMYNTNALATYQTDGAHMVGMTVTATFSDGSIDTRIWAATAATSATSGGVFGSCWSLVSLNDTYEYGWTLSNTRNQTMTNLFIDAGTGSTVFDVSPVYELSPDSAKGEAYYTWYAGDVTATYADQVSVGGVYYGDLYRTLNLSFGDNGSGTYGFSGTDFFSADTDSLAKIGDITPIDSVPEPATMLLFGVGLLGLAGVSRRKK